MASFRVGSGLDNYIKDLETLLKDVEPGMKYAIYFGAKVVTDEVRKEINALPVGQKSEGDTINALQKKGLLEGLGVSSIQRIKGTINTRLGFNGYNGIHTPKYPTGQPNAMIARSICAGTSFRKANDFVYRAVDRVDKKAEEVMKKALDTYVAAKMRTK